MPKLHQQPPARAHFFHLWAAVVLVLSLVGCSSLVPPPPEAGPFYRSELADPGAKALFAYSEYRLLAADNRWPEAISALERTLAFDPQNPYLQMSLAKALLHRNETDRSIDILQQLLQQQADNAEAHELLGDLYSYRQQYPEAITHYRQALQQTPDSEMLRMRLAMAYGRQGRNDEAIEVLLALIEAHPEARLARLALARFYTENDEPEQAAEAYRDLLALYPDDRQAVLEYGKLLEDRQLFAEAFTLYRAAILRDPRAAEIRQQLAHLYLEQRRLPEALEQLQIISQQFPENLAVLARIGLIQLQLDQLAEAEQVFRHLLQRNPEESRNRYYLGMALLGQGKTREAIEVMAPIDDSSPLFADAVLQLAYLYRQNGQEELAIGALRKVLEKGIQRAEVYFYLATFLSDQQKNAEAAEVVEKGLALFPHNLNLLYQQGVLFEKSHQSEKALEAMRKILTLDADHADALNFLAYYQAEKGEQLELALSRAQKALAAKKSGYIIDTLGWIYFKMGRYAESRERLEEASSLQPNDPVILEHLGDLYRALTLWDKAAATYRRVLELNPEAPGVIEKLQSLPAGARP